MNSTWWKQNWPEPLIASNYIHKPRTLFFWLLFICSAGICGYLLFQQYDFLLENYAKGNYKNMQIALSAIIPVAFFIIAAKKSITHINFGETPLHLDTFPTKVGNAFLGRVDILRRVKGRDFSAELILHKFSVNHQAVDNGKSIEEATTKTVWRMPVTINKRNQENGIQLLLEARLPDNAPPSSPPSHDEYHQWQLHVISSDRTFQRTWDIPIVS